MFAGGPRLRFTRDDAGGTAPILLAATASDDDFIWRGPAGQTFTGKTPHIDNFPVGNFTLQTKKWDSITSMQFLDRKLTAFDIAGVAGYLTALETLQPGDNAGLVGDIGRVFPAAQFRALKYLGTRSTGITGDIAIWKNLPGGLIEMSAWNNLGITGDISVLVNTSTVLVAVTMMLTPVTYGTGGFFATMLKVGVAINMAGCGWTTAMVDRALVDCVASNLINSTIVLDGVMDAPTDGQNNASRLTLVGRGWTVTVNG